MNILVIGLVWPEPRSTAAGKRMLQVLDLFLERGDQIYFGSTATKNERSFDLNLLGINCLEIELNSSTFDILLLSVRPDLVLFDRFISEEQFGWRVAEACPGALRILDTEDLHFLRNTRRSLLQSDQDFIQALMNDEIAKREIASIYRCDLSLIISDAEMSLLQEHFQISPQLLCHLPFLSDPVSEEELQQYPPFEARKDFMTIGNFRHEPNRQSVLDLKQRIWPAIRERLPEVNLFIYGAYCDAAMLKLHNEKEGFFVIGPVDQAKDAFVKARICLAPIRFGAGQKGKLFEAMLYGTPSITTHLGAEGMNGNLPWNGFITDDFSVFIEESVRLYSDQDLWSGAQRNGIKILNTCFNKENYVPAFFNKLETLKDNLVLYRNKNFIGSMLMAETVKSTKYLSKWIEEKNKKK